MSNKARKATLTKLIQRLEKLEAEVADLLGTQEAKTPPLPEWPKVGDQYMALLLDEHLENTRVYRFDICEVDEMKGTMVVYGEFAEQHQGEEPFFGKEFTGPAVRKFRRVLSVPDNFHEASHRLTDFFSGAAELWPYRDIGSATVRRLEPVPKDIGIPEDWMYWVDQSANIPGNSFPPPADMIDRNIHTLRDHVLRGCK